MWEGLTEMQKFRYWGGGGYLSGQLYMIEIYRLTKLKAKRGNTRFFLDPRSDLYFSRS